MVNESNAKCGANSANAKILFILNHIYSASVSSGFLTLTHCLTVSQHCEIIIFNFFLLQSNTSFYGVWERNSVPVKEALYAKTSVSTLYKLIANSNSLID